MRSIVLFLIISLMVVATCFAWGDKWGSSGWGGQKYGVGNWNNGNVSSGDWILDTGNWNDSGSWIDTKTWDDGA